MADLTKVRVINSNLDPSPGGCIQSMAYITTVASLWTDRAWPRKPCRGEVEGDSVSKLGGHNLCPKPALIMDLKVPIKRANLKVESGEKKDLFNVATLGRGTVP